MAIEITSEYMERVDRMIDDIRESHEQHPIFPKNLIKDRIEAHLRKRNVTDEEERDYIATELTYTAEICIVNHMCKNIRRAMVAMLVEATEEFDKAAQKLADEAE